MTLTPLQELAKSLHNCQRCKLAKLGRSQVVFGVGNPHASIMFVGEAPGANEDLKGEPFVGAAGKILNDLLASANLSRDQIYIAKDVLPAALRNRLLRLAAFQNPEFYRAQAMRLSTYDKPRIIGCAEDLPAHLRWPTGGTRREGTFPPLRDVVERAEREHLLRALAAARGSKRRAIELLQISSETFYRRLDEFGLRKKDE